MTRLLALSALFAPSVAAATPFSLHPTPLITAQPGTFYADGIGSPSVTYVPNGGSAGNGGYVMFFETRLPAAWLAENVPGNNYSLCSGGRPWGIGMAVSDDGLNNWTVLGDAPIFLPQPGSYYSCVAAHPKGAYDANATGGAKLQVFFKAEESRPTGGSNLQRGVGLVQVRRTGAWGSLAGWEAAPFNAPILALTNFGFPAVSQHENLWYMWVAQVPSVYLATRFGSLGNAFASPGATPSFAIQPIPVIEPGATTWTPSRVYNPAVVCRNNSAYPFTMFVGGKDVDASGNLTAGGWGQSLSSNGTEWFISAEPEFSWTSTNDWRHWDALLVQPGANECDTGPADADYLIYYSIRDANQRNQIGFAYTSASWVKSDTRAKVCVNSAVGFDFDARSMERPGEVPVAPAVGGFDDESVGPASCSTSGSPLMLGLFAPFALLLRRRRA